MNTKVIARPRTLAEKIVESIVERVITLAGFAAIAILALILLFLLRDGLPFLREYSFARALGGINWYPISFPPVFGMLPLILGSVVVTAGALALAVPLGVASAIFIAEVAPGWSRSIFKTVIEVLATIPSVVYGFIGLATLAPLISRLPGVVSGQTALLGSVILAIMALPTIISISEDVMYSIPNTYRTASLAMGATRWQTIHRVVVPAARPGILAATMLAMGRVVGETMAVLMVTGNAASIPKLQNLLLLQSVRTLTATIAQEMGEVVFGSPHYHALFMIGLILFLITFAINLAADVVLRRIGGGR